MILSLDPRFHICVLKMMIEAWAIQILKIAFVAMQRNQGTIFSLSFISGEKYGKESTRSYSVPTTQRPGITSHQTDLDTACSWSDLPSIRPCTTCGEKEIDGHTNRPHCQLHL